MIDNDSYWLKHLKRNNSSDIRSLSEIIEIDMSKVLDNETYIHTMDTPESAINDIIDAARELVVKDTEHPKYKPLIRFINIGKKILIKDLRPDKDENHLRSFSCLVKRVSPLQSKVLKACFRCPAGHYTFVKTKHDQIIQPKSCKTEGCNFRDLEYVDERDDKIVRQFIYVQELLDNIGADHQPKSIRCEVFRDLCNATMAGDLVVLNGYYRTSPKRKDGVLQAGKDSYFEVNSMERNENEFGNIKWTEAEEQQMQDLFKQPDIYDLLVDSIAPSIMGMRLCKQAIVMMLFGGVTKTMSDGTRRRGHLNLLIEIGRAHV